MRDADEHITYAEAGKGALLRPADGTSKGWCPTTLLTRFAEELRRVGRKYEGAEVIVRW